MIERESSRARKSVDYTKFAEDGDSDDDFKESTPPLAKRQKVSNNKENSKQTVKPTQTNKLPKPTQTNTEPKPKKPRQTLEEKLYERELQKALELSLSQSDGSQESTTVTKVTVDQDVPVLSVKECVDVDVPILSVEENDDSQPPSPILPIEPPILHKENEREDVIEVLATGINVTEDNVKSLSRRKAATKKRFVESDSEGEEPDFEVDLRKFLSSPLSGKFAKKDEDSDFEVIKVVEDISDESDEDFNADDSDSDFGVSKKKKGKTVTSTPKPAKSVKTNTSTEQLAPAVTKKSLKNEDFEVDKVVEDISDDSDEDFNADDSDSDFGVSKKKKGKKVTNTPKPGKSVKTNTSTEQLATVVTKKSLKSTSKPSTSIPKAVTPTPVLKKSAVKHSPTVSKPFASVTTAKTPSSAIPSRKTPIWTPPASSTAGRSPLGGDCVKSPSTGLRIGLSRNMKLKPLHPNLKINN